MDNQDLVKCKCGAWNLPGAITCHQCSDLFDGSAGNSIPHSRRLTKGQSVRFSDNDDSASGRTQRVGRPDAGALWQPPRSGLIVPNPVEIRVAVISFSARAELQTGPAHPSQIPPFELYPETSTNEAAGLALADDIWQKQLPKSRLNLIMFGDGVPTTGGDWFVDPGKAALDVAGKLKRQRARIATIGFQGPTMDFGHLRALASSAALAWEAQAGNLTRTFLTATQTMTSKRWGQKGGEFVVFLIDQSGSMGEGNKKTEVESAVNASIEFLRNL